jgi:uncharacterized protein (TIGR02466 family)
MISTAGSGAQVASLFETPVILDDYPQAGQANADFTRRILQKRSESPGVAISNVGGWHSSTDMAYWGGDHLLPLVERIVGLADRFTSDVKASGAPRFVWYPEVWANVSGAGASNTFHYHSGCVWSAIYYVSDGYATADQDAGGELVLLDPRAPAVTMTAPDLRYRRPDGKIYASEATLRPRTGRIVMFPSWLMHSVRLYRGSGTRISIAVNLSALPAPKPR